MVVKTYMCTALAVVEIKKGEYIEIVKWRDLKNVRLSKKHVEQLITVLETCLNLPTSPSPAQLKERMAKVEFMRELIYRTVLDTGRNFHDAHMAGNFFLHAPLLPLLRKV